MTSTLTDSIAHATSRSTSPAGADASSSTSRAISLSRVRGAVGIGVLTFFPRLPANTTRTGSNRAGRDLVHHLRGVVLVVHRPDRPLRQTPHKLMVVAFLWGGFAATGAMAANANDAILALYGKNFGQVWALNWAPGSPPRSPRNWPRDRGCCC